MSSFSQAVAQGAVMNEVISALNDVERVDYGNYEHGGKRYPILAMKHQIREAGITRTMLFVPITPSPATNSLTTNSNIQFLLRAGTGEKLLSACLKFNLTESGGSNSVTTVMAPLFINYLEWWGGSGTTTMIQRQYGETLWLNNGIYLSNEKLTILAPMEGMTSAMSPSTSGPSSVTIPASGAQNFTVPLIGSWIDLHRPVLNSLTSDVMLKLYLRNSVSSGSGTLSLSSLTLAFEHVDLSEKDNSLHLNIYASKCFRTVFLDCVNVPTTMTVTASVQNKISLQNLKGKCPFLLVIFRSSVASTSQGYSTLSSLGDQNVAAPFQIDMLSASNTPLLGHGTPLDIRDISDYFSSLFPSQLLTNLRVYPIVFGEIKKALVGDLSGGYFYFDGSNINLAITPGSAWSTGTYTVDVYAFFFKQLFQCAGNLNVKDA